MATGKDLQSCVRLLSNMLDKDQARKLPIRKGTVQQGKVKKEKSKGLLKPKTKQQMKKHKRSPAVKSKSPSIIKDQTPAAVRNLNEYPTKCAQNLTDEIPVRDTSPNINHVLREKLYGPSIHIPTAQFEHKNASFELHNHSIPSMYQPPTVPFNTRLSSSTPVNIPSKSAGTASIQLSPKPQRKFESVVERKQAVQTNVDKLLSSDDQESQVSAPGRIQDHALNSFQFIKATQSPIPEVTGPRLIQGQVEFQPHPSSVPIDPQDLQRKYDEAKAQAAKLQYSLYSDRSDMHSHGDPNKVNESKTLPLFAETSSLPCQETNALKGIMKDNMSEAALNPAEYVPQDNQNDEMQRRVLIIAQQQAQMQQQLLELQHQKYLLQSQEHEAEDTQDVHISAKPGSAHYKPITPFRASAESSRLSASLTSQKAECMLDKIDESIQAGATVSSKDAIDQEYGNKDVGQQQTKSVGPLVENLPPHVSNLAIGNAKKVSFSKCTKKTKPEKGKKTGVKKKATKKPSTIKEVKESASDKENYQTEEEEDLLDSPPSKEATVNAGPPAGSSKFSKHLAAVKHQLRELRTVAGMNKDLEIKRLVRELEDTLVKKIGVMEWQLEWDLAMQPLRSENAQLRRKLRILSQQMKDKDEQLKNAEKPDPSFQVVHLQMVNYQQQKDLAEERASRERLRKKVAVLNEELAKLTQEKHDLLHLMGNKDRDVVKAQKDLVNENQTLRAEVLSGKEDLGKEKEALEESRRQVGMMRIDMAAKDRELLQLNDLVRSLKGSMTTLLGELQSAPRPGLSSVGRLSDGLQQIDILLSAKKPDRKPSEQLTQENLAAFNKSQSNKPLPNSRDLQWENLLQPGLGQSHTSPKDKSPREVSSRSLFKQGGASSKTLQMHGKKLEKSGAWTSPRGSDRRTSNRTSQGPETLQSGRTSSVQMSNFSDVDNTEYLLPQGMSPFVHAKSKIPVSKSVPPKSREGKSSTESTPTGPTVKELLTPLAERMDKIQALSSEKLAQRPGENGGEKMSAARSLKFGAGQDHNPNDEPIELPKSVVDMSFGSHLDHQGEEGEEGDGTFTESKAQQEEVPTLMENSAAKSAEQSRYSVTDYFKKYGGGRGTLTIGVTQVQDDLEYQSILSVSGGESLSSGENEATAQQADPQTGAEKTFFRRQGVRKKSLAEGPENVRDMQLDDVEVAEKTYGEQEGLYKGTELDTSISTIEDPGTAPSVTSQGSVSSVDDQAFRQGLADLDANIAKMQQALRDSLQ